MNEISNQKNLKNLLVASITPYFLEKENIWFEENLQKILESTKLNPFFEDNVVFVEEDQVFNLSNFLRRLDEMGYERVLEISEIGEFSQRGGIIDVFPINLNYATRIEFFGNKIETIEKLPVEIKNEKSEKEILKKGLKAQQMFSDLKSLKEGDYIVHLDHGVARFAGIGKMQLPVRDFQRSPYSQFSRFQTEDYYVLEYAAGDKLYVPLGLERKLSRYIGFTEPKVSRLGSSLWQKTKKRIKEETEKFAKELLEIYAKRELTQRPAYTAESEVENSLASSFSFEETPDQVQAIEDIKKDLERTEPMDRLVCGDVGFGKTEVALRAMAKAVNSGYQVAMICPTTILAKQHFENFKQRLQGLPIKIAMMSRLQTKKEQRETVRAIKEGGIDIVVGTHRILSNDVEFKNLGLLVIDDEQRFGVKQKERLKKIRTSLDVLSLSATPIPRTLYLALSSLKKISFVQIPPSGRLPIKTFVLPWSAKIIKNAIEKEIARAGQIYYLHNRVQTIEMVKRNLEILVPGAKFGVGHGRLSEKELVEVMSDFQNKKIDVLIATTIIENGIDLPNVNTLIVADGMRLGLSQAYQIRGRIGRSNTQSFAYFLYPEKLSPLAKERLTALKEAEELGSGYKIAIKDMEIRGAGNILGREQSGSVNKVGLNLYCQMLSEAVERMRAE